MFLCPCRYVASVNLAKITSRPTSAAVSWRHLCKVAPFLERLLQHNRGNFAPSAIESYLKVLKEHFLHLAS